MESIQLLTSIFCPYYETKDMLAKQLETWCNYPLTLRKQLEFIVVDDGSPDNPAVINKVPLNLIHARILVNIPWNHPGSQNLCAHLSSGNWVWSGGIDHVFTEENMWKLLKLDKSNEKVFYKIPRFSVNEKKFVGYHWEINFLARKTFFDIGGYDEDFSGTWGADDVCFCSRLKKFGNTEIKLPQDQIHLMLYTEKDFPEANSHYKTDKDSWGPRKMNPRNKNLWHSKIMGGVLYGQNPLRFPWKIINKYTI